MKKDIQLTGIGNALIDLQYQVQEHELASLEFEKGAMTLVNIDKQKQIIAKFKDRIHHKCSGGSAANTIIAFAAFGGIASYKTHLGADQFGDYYFKEFEELDIHLCASQIDSEPTGTCFVMITPDSERTMVTSLGATVRHKKEHIDEDIIKRSEWIYIEGYKFSEADSSEAVHYAVELAKKYDCKIAVTFSDKFIIDNFKENLEYVVDNADLIFCNDIEAKAYTNTDNVKDAFDKLSKKVNGVALTLGEHGSLIQWEGEKHEIPAYKIKAVDATGAGDMYAGGFLYGIINSNEPHIAGHLASYAASLVVGQLGARLEQDHNKVKNMIFNDPNL